MKRQRLIITGNIQGVGFRPFIWRRAHELELTGWVRNDSSGVTIEIQGTDERIDAFLSGLVESCRPLAIIDSIEPIEMPAARDESSFTILQSSAQADQSTPISPDVATCSDCLRELSDNRDRRYRYPFVNCTNCGPRFTIIEDIPYDRPLTTMKSFVMCSTCQQEYDDPSDRRFHAQPNACPACGPRIWFVSSNEDLRSFESWRDAGDLERTLDSFRSEIDRGGIVAVKGIGGFHLACDANNANAIDELRRAQGSD